MRILDAAALAKLSRGMLLTSDQEFHSVKSEIKIDWV